MSKCVFGLLLALLLPQVLLGKARNLYSVFTELHYYRAEDTIRIINTIKKGTSLKTSNKDSALYYMHMALAESKLRNYDDGIAFSLFNLGLAYSARNNNETALQSYKEAIVYAKKSEQYQYLIPALYNNIGLHNIIIGDYFVAFKYYDSAMRASIDIGLPRERKHFVIILNNLGSIQLRLNQVAASLKYFDESEVICRKANLLPELATTLAYKAIAYQLMQQNEKAEQHCKEAIQILAPYSDMESVAAAVSFKTKLAELKLKKGDAQEALKLLQKTQKVGYTFYKGQTSIGPNYMTGISYLQLKDYKQAEHYLMMALKESNALNIAHDLVDIYQAISQVYDSLGNPRKALHYYYLYQQLKDSLMSREKAKDIVELDIKYRILEKDRELVVKKLQITQQQNRLKTFQFWIGGVSLGALLLAVIAFSNIRSNRQKLKNKNRQIHILQQQQEINHLKDIVQGEEKERIRIARELHDGIISQLMATRLHFNGALQHAQGLQNREDFENTLIYLDAATKELRKTAHNLMPEIVLYEGLVNAISNYCEMMSKATKEQIYVQIYGKYKRYNPDVEISLYRIVQELLQNAIKHAGCTQVIIELHIEEDQLAITVEDDGQGFVLDQKKFPAGMGLKSIYSRVKILKGKIDIEGRAGNGTTVNMEFNTTSFYV